MISCCLLGKPPPHRRPRPRRPWRPGEGVAHRHACHHQRTTCPQCAHDAHFARFRLPRGSGPHRQHDVEADVERAGTAGNECIARERRLTGLVAPKHIESGLLNRRRRPIRRPIVGAHDENPLCGPTHPSWRERSWSSIDAVSSTRKPIHDPPGINACPTPNYAHREWLTTWHWCS